MFTKPERSFASLFQKYFICVDNPQTQALLIARDDLQVVYRILTFHVYFRAETKKKFEPKAQEKKLFRSKARKSFESFPNETFS